jgi:fibronectin type 3 domain-containing protein
MWWRFLLYAAILGTLSIYGEAQATSLSFAWNAVTTNTDGSPGIVDTYNLYRSQDGGATFAKLTSVPGTVTAVSDPAVPVGNICYQVTASNRAGESAASNRLCFQMPSARPQAPANLHTTGE